MRCVAALVMLSVASCSRVNYCGSKMCGHTDAHTFCQFPRWVDELAREAQRWADQCRPATTPEEHDVCRDLYSMTVGQCVASVVGEAPGLRVESMIDLWHMQAMFYKGNVTSYIPPKSNAAYYGDFAQMLWSKTYMVGCGRSRFMSVWRGRLRSTERLVCNFSPRGPPAARALWTPAPPAAACPTSTFPDTPLTALCTYQPESINNEYDIDNSMALEEYVTLNTVLEIERNGSLKYHGSLDELYLTKMAILTMNNMVISTENYNYIQKRDIADILLLEDAKADVYAIAYERDLQNVSVEAKLPQVYTVIKKPRIQKKKMSIVGRPKTYNMDDLNDVRHENVYIIMEKIGRNEKDLYTDYEFKESDDKSSSNGENPIVFINPEKYKRKYVNDIEIPTTTTAKLDNDTTVVRKIKNAIFDNLKRHTSNDTKPVKHIEDYLNDSETVRELQEALERIEQTLGPKLAEGQGKVRRDLRDLTEEKNPDDSAVQETNSVSSDVKRNKTNERGPMLNMVLKYMPYLKHYENEILGNCGCSLTPGVVLILALFFV